MAVQALLLLALTPVPPTSDYRSPPYRPKRAPAVVRVLEAWCGTYAITPIVRRGTPASPQAGVSGVPTACRGPGLTPPAAQAPLRPE